MTPATSVRDRPHNSSVSGADAIASVWSDDGGMTITPAGVCNGWARRPRVVVVVAHRAMREFIVELLDCDRGAWAVSAVDSVPDLDGTASSNPDLVIVDTADFATCCSELPATFGLARVVVIGPEPNDAYQQDALQRGAGAWLSRDCVAEELCDTLRSTLARA